MAAGHVRVSSRLVDEDQALGIETELTVELALAPPQDVGSILLDSMAGFLHVHAAVRKDPVKAGD